MYNVDQVLTIVTTKESFCRFIEGPMTPYDFWMKNNWINEMFNAGSFVVIGVDSDIIKIMHPSFSKTYRLSYEQVTFLTKRQVKVNLYATKR